MMKKYGGAKKRLAEMQGRPDEECVICHEDAKREYLFCGRLLCGEMRPPENSPHEGRKGERQMRTKLIDDVTVAVNAVGITVYRFCSPRR